MSNSGAAPARLAATLRCMIADVQDHPRRPESPFEPPSTPPPGRSLRWGHPLALVSAVRSDGNTFSLTNAIFAPNQVSRVTSFFPHSCSWTFKPRWLIE